MDWGFKSWPWQDCGVLSKHQKKKPKKLPFTFGAVKKQLSDLMCLLLITGVFNGLVKCKGSFPLGTVNLKNTFNVLIITIIILYNDRSRAV